MKQFREHLAAYRLFHLRESTSHDNQDLKESAKIAWDTLKAACRNEDVLTKAYLLQPDEQLVRNNISSWIHAAGPSMDIRTYSMAFPDECADRLRHLTSQSHASNAESQWPYIERVRYGHSNRAS